MPIYDLSYQRYDGPRRLGFLWWTIARTTAQATLKKPANSRYLFFIFVTFLGFAFLVYFWRTATEYATALFEIDPDTGSLEIRLGHYKFPLSLVFFRYLSILFWPVILYVITSVSAALSADVLGGGLTVILARPLRRRHYVFGKVLGLAGPPTLSATLVIFGAFVLLWGYYFNFFQMLHHLPVLLCSSLYLFLAGGMCGLSAVAFHPRTSTFRKSAGWLFFYWFGTWIFSTASSNQALRTIVSMGSPIHLLDGIYLWLTGVSNPQGVDSRFLRDVITGDVPFYLLPSALLVHFLLLAWRTRNLFVGVR